MSKNKNLFSGREMTCCKCGWKFKSSLEFESMWTTVQVEDKLIDFCPKCWGIPRHRWPAEVREAWAKDHAE